MTGEDHVTGREKGKEQKPQQRKIIKRSVTVLQIVFVTNIYISALLLWCLNDNHVFTSDLRITLDSSHDVPLQRAKTLLQSRISLTACLYHTIKV